MVLIWTLTGLWKQKHCRPLMMEAKRSHIRCKRDIFLCVFIYTDRSTGSYLRVVATTHWLTVLIRKVNVILLLFCKTTDKFKLYVSLRCNFLLV